MKFARSFSNAAQELEGAGKVDGEFTPLKTGDRVYFLTVSGEFEGTVERDWSPPADDDAHRPMVHVALDTRTGWPVEFHRTLFRAFTVLDHIAHI